MCIAGNVIYSLLIALASSVEYWLLILLFTFKSFSLFILKLKDVPMNNKIVANTIKYFILSPCDFD